MCVVGFFVFVLGELNDKSGPKLKYIFHIYLPQTEDMFLTPSLMFECHAVITSKTLFRTSDIILNVYWVIITRPLILLHGIKVGLDREIPE